ncbi:MAG: methyltransferase domain-containing protein [Nitrospirota bacterium]|jgi:2-polyprenyl-3-methyl-5-hydroxy-6-metoxy-1,4-benzoquinol methylase
MPVIEPALGNDAHLSAAWDEAASQGRRVAALGDRPTARVRALAEQRGVEVVPALHVDATSLGEAVHDTLARVAAGDRLAGLIYSGAHDRFAILALLSRVEPLLADGAMVLIDHADFAAVHQGICEGVMTAQAYRLHEIAVVPDDASRPGAAIAVLSHDRARRHVQPASTIPSTKNKRLASGFATSLVDASLPVARSTVAAAVARWTPRDRQRAEEIYHTLMAEFPDQESPKSYWHDAVHKGFTDFFTWGHDQSFGFQLNRAGAMGTRHQEIAAEAISLGYLPADLTGKRVLDVGCWTGGDVLVLSGLGADVTALEEHPTSAAAAGRLCSMLGVPARVDQRSLYREESEWRGQFDVVYLSGVVYHLTDPLLALRLCFAYLKPGGRVIVETKASAMSGPYCEYAGTSEKGWNWYAPTMETLGRWLVDAGFPRGGIQLHTRPVGRLLACAGKEAARPLPERSGFSRPGSWMEESS